MNKAIETGRTKEEMGRVVHRIRGKFDGHPRFIMRRNGKNILARWNRFNALRNDLRFVLTERRIIGFLISVDILSGNRSNPRFIERKRADLKVVREEKSRNSLESFFFLHYFSSILHFSFPRYVMIKNVVIIRYTWMKLEHFAKGA